MNYFQLLESLNELYDLFEGQEIECAAIVKKIKRKVPFRECRFFAVETMSLPYGKFIVSGLYDPNQDEQGKPSIQIEIAFPKVKKLRFDNYNLRREHWAELCIDLASILGHEFMHVNQFRKRQFEWPRAYQSKNPDYNQQEIENYYGDSDEIGAYAFMAAAEVCLDSFSTKKKKDVTKTNLYKTYTKIFKKHDPVVLKFVKLTNQYTRRLEKQYHATTFR